MKRNSFVFYKDWMKAVEDLPNEIRLEIYEGIIEYATTGYLPDLKPMAKIAFNFMKTTIDRDIEKYMSIVKRNRTNGQSGGRPKNPNNPVGILETQDNPNNLDNDNVNDSDKEKEIYKEKEFVKPSIQEIESYCKERNNGIDAELFFNSYEAKGWMYSGKNKIKDWKAAVRTWEIRNKRQQKEQDILGVGEFIKDGKRYYGKTSPIEIPMDMPPRPSERHYFNSSLKQWNV